MLCGCTGAACVDAGCPLSLRVYHLVVYVRTYSYSAVPGTVMTERKDETLYDTMRFRGIYQGYFDCLALQSDCSKSVPAST